MNQISTVEFIKKSTPNGYIKLLTDDGWKMEHVFVVESYVNRSLNGKEVVHHIDGVRTNNLISNLVIFPTQKDHAHYHRQKKQFKDTKPLKTLILNLKLKMVLERNLNLKGVNI